MSWRSNISPGDKVLCILDCNDETDGVLAHWLCGAEITAGSTYTVLEVIRDVDQFEEEATGLILVERGTHWPRSRDGKLGAWHIAHFSAPEDRKTALASAETTQWLNEEIQTNGS